MRRGVSAKHLWWVDVLPDVFQVKDGRIKKRPLLEENDARLGRRPLHYLLPNASFCVDWLAGLKPGAYPGVHAPRGPARLSTRLSGCYPAKYAGPGPFFAGNGAHRAAGAFTPSA